MLLFILLFDDIHDTPSSTKTQVKGVRCALDTSALAELGPRVGRVSFVLLLGRRNEERVNEHNDWRRVLIHARPDPFVDDLLVDEGWWRWLQEYTPLCCGRLCLTPTCFVWATKIHGQIIHTTVWYFAPVILR